MSVPPRFALGFSPINLADYQTMYRSIIGLGAVLLVSLVVSSASGERQRPVVRISLSVSGSDGLDSRITSYLGRELRTISRYTALAA